MSKVVLNYHKIKTDHETFDTIHEFNFTVKIYPLKDEGNSHIDIENAMEEYYRTLKEKYDYPK